MGKINAADKLLCCVAGVFCFFMALKISNPDNIIIAGLFFCSEAALVGGIADWFAVTALFKKPLGFPGHTALISHKRDSLIEGCIRMVQKEFFSPKSLIARLKGVCLTDKLLEFMNKNHGQEMLTAFFLEYVEKQLQKIDTVQSAEQLAKRLKNEFKALDLTKMANQLGEWLIKNGKDQELFDYILLELDKTLEEAATRQRIVDYIQTYIDEQSKKNAMLAMLAMFAQSTNILNVDEAADVIQEELRKFVVELKSHEHPMRSWLINELGDSARALQQNERWNELANEWQSKVVDNLECSQLIQKFIEDIIYSVCRNHNADIAGNSKSLALQTALAEIISHQVEFALREMKNNALLKEKTEKYLYDFAGRVTLQAQAMLGIIVREVMKNLSDEQLNELIYSKVDKDLIWIRMNGSIVGAGIGMILFIVMQVTMR